MDRITINMKDLLLCISNAQEIMSPKLFNHQQQVAYLSFRLSKQLGLSLDEQKDIFIAALVHDIGALSIKEKLELIEEEPLDVNSHAFKGAKLIEGFQPLYKASKLIKYHHIQWNNGEGIRYKGEDVPFGSHIIHLADRVCAMIQQDFNVIAQVGEIISEINKEKGIVYPPILADKLIELCKKEYIWLDLISKEPVRMISNMEIFNIVQLEIDDIVDFALIFSQIIDFRSSFTARHSAGVAKTAQQLAQLFSFSPYECKQMLIAGYLHDLGKVAISSDILEKPEKLSDDEFNIIRSHSYYTYRLLEMIKEFKVINIWASYHHEKLHGEGYPFHIKGENLSLGSRIIAVADIFTALKEPRPYRRGMEDEEAKEVLTKMSANGEIDLKVVEILIDNFQIINERREQAQEEAAQRYKSFLLC